MTRLRKNLLFLLALSLTFFACNPDQNPSEEILEEPLRENEVVELLDTEFQAVSQGINVTLQDVISTIINTTISGTLCNSILSDTVSTTYGPNSHTQLSYYSDYSFQLTCPIFNLPSDASFSASADFDLNSLKIQSENSLDLSGDVTGLWLFTDTIEVNGNLEKRGEQEMDIYVPRSLNSVLTADLVDLKISKSGGLQIDSGIANFSLTGSTANHGNFRYTGSLTFLGNNQGLLLLNGTSYPIDWN